MGPSSARARRTGPREPPVPVAARSRAKSPRPLRQTRQGKPLTSTVDVVGTVMTGAGSIVGGAGLGPEWRQRRTQPLLQRLRPPTVLPFREKVFELRHNLLGEKLRVVARQ